MKKWLNYALIVSVGLTISAGVVLGKDRVLDVINDKKDPDVVVSYVERDMLISKNYPFVINLSGYKTDELYTDKKMSSMIELYRLDKNKVTKVEFDFKVKGSKVSITPRNKVNYGDLYEAVFRVRDRTDEQITLRVTINTGHTAYQVVENEYGFRWKIEYLKEYKRLSAYDNKDNRVMGYQTEVGTERFGIRIGDMKSSVVNKYGEGLSTIEKRDKSFKLVLNGEYDIYRIDGYYVTFFYDTFDGNRIRSIYWVREDVEAMKTKFYGEPSDDLAEGFEEVMVNLVNDTRIRMGLRALTYDTDLNKIARLHSRDMIDKGYFDHVNKEGLKALDRMENGGYKGRMKMAGENLAYGQMNSVYAHEGLVNSKGHRENMLRPEYTHVGAGVEFTDSGVPYWTILFYTEAK